jgi:hypothetical protein
MEMSPEEVKEVMSGVVVDPMDRRSTQEIAEAVAARGQLSGEVNVELVRTHVPVVRLDRTPSDGKGGRIRGERLPHLGG